jgi:GNAT superfamily N-acetyltransferase
MRHCPDYPRCADTGMLQRMSGAGIRFDELERRAATAADVPFLIELRQQTMTAHQVAAGLVPSDDERRSRVLVRYECAEILVHAGKPVGLLKVARDGLDWDLIQIQLILEYQDRGLGSQLIRSLVAEARQVGASLRLSVLRGSPARRLYERLGFTVHEETEHATTMVPLPRPVNESPTS